MSGPEANPTDRPAGRPRDVTFVMPQDWWRIRLLDEKSRRADIAALARQVTAGRPDADHLGAQLKGLLEEATDGADGRYAVETWVSLLVNSGWPIACSLTLSIIPAPGRAGSGLLHAGLVEAGGVGAEVTVIDTLAGPATRVRHRTTTALGGSEFASEVVQYAIAMPDGDGVALLSFSTPLVGAIEAFLGLFDSIVSSTRWLW